MATSFQGLGDLPGGAFKSAAINVSAQGSTVVGWSQSANGKEAFVWTQAGGMQGIGDLPGGGFSSVANAVSNNGLIVVGCGQSSERQQTITEAFRWTAVGGMVGLGDLPGGDTFSCANDFSSTSSTVVGVSSSLPGNTEGFTMGGGGLMFGTANVHASIETFTAVSEEGTHVGHGGFEYYTQAFRHKNLLTLGLGHLGGYAGIRFSQAFDVSADGRTIVGMSYGPLGAEAFRWTASLDEMVSLGAGTATGVSGDGSIIVGQTSSPFHGAFIWRAETDQIESLHNYLINRHGLGPALAGWTLLAATKISVDGHTIVGNGLNPAGQFEGWRAHIGPELIPPPGRDD
ncbi:PEP-CTERM sorting domain-containing protein [Pseudomarimonas arenosa]|uniref:PEP-CTERM sorting domain-containing protein n=1 Tax=Pseudomarimonas arenosa TaxID=2774145 RepID=A0AAW3ZS63_9GAMM|nr:PEP-CTERM sorting domain-containing protein [Pseudomarimonas arenosa]